MNKNRFAMKMRKAAIGALALCGIVLGATSASAAIILQDDFSGAAGAPDAAKWTTAVVGAGTILLDGSGSVISTVGSGASSLNGLAAFDALPGAGEFGRLTYVLTDTSSSPNEILGLDAGSADRVQVRTDLGGGFWSVYLETGGSNNIIATTVATSVRTGTWEIEWDPSLAEVRVSYNGSSEFDSSTGGPFNISTGTALGPKFDVYGAAGSSSGLDSVVWETVPIPEPSSAVLFSLALAGLAASRNRRK